MARMAIYVPNNFTSETSLSLGKVGGKKKINANESYYFSVMGRNRLPSSDPDNHANLFVPLTKDFHCAVIMPDFPAGYNNDFTCSWISSLLEDMAEEGEVWFGYKNEKSQKKNRLLNYETFQSRFPNCQVKKYPGWTQTWVKISRQTNPQKQSFKSIYPYFHKAFNDFCDVYGQAKYNGNGKPANLEKEAWETYLYSLFGANQKTYILEKIIEDYLPEQQITGMDLGGGYGFLAGELAVKGHSMTVLDIKDFQIEVCRWLGQRCHLESHLSSQVSPIEQASAEDDSLNLISYFGCLLYVDRQYIPDVFHKSMQMLKPGGILVIHENMRETIKPSNPDHQKCFTFTELDSLLKHHAGNPTYYWANVAKKADSVNQISKRTLVAVVQKAK